MDYSTGETFNDVMFEPQYSEVESRSTISTTANMGKFLLELPLISANMNDITGPKMAVKMAKYGGLGILHRFGSIDESVKDFKDTIDAIDALYMGHELHDEIQYPKWMTPEYSVGVSLGVQPLDKIRFEKLYAAGARLFCIDVAHGHHILVKRMIEYIRGFEEKEIESQDDDDYDYYKICIIAGNVATYRGAKDLKEWGADIIKIGIGPGSVCETRKNTGVGVPQLKALREIRRHLPELPLIADGGIKHNGDIPKALKYANACMVGSLIAGTSETPGHVYQNDKGEFYKVYGGSASGERKVENGRDNSFVEGVIKLVPFRGKVKFILRKAKDCIRSSMSYSGAGDLTTFKHKSILIDMGSGAKQESKI